MNEVEEVLNKQTVLADVFKEEDVRCYYGCFTCAKGVLLTGTPKDFIIFKEGHLKHETKFFIIIKKGEIIGK